MYGTYPSRRHRLWSDDRLLDHALSMHKNLVGRNSHRQNKRELTPVNRHIGANSSSGYITGPPPPGRGYEEDELYGKITSVDFLPTDNAAAHATDKYDLVRKGGIVVRRGQQFKVIVKFDRKFSLRNNTLRFVFTIGPNPKPGKGTHVQCLLSTVANANGWAVILRGRQQRKSEAIVAITTPPDCIVGDWRLTIENVVTQGNKPLTLKYYHPDPVYILFNPWNKDDDVHFDIKDLLEEYVLNDSGVIFNGNYKQIGAKPWFYGQFEDEILEAALFCVQQGFKNQYGQAMSDPVRVCRVISRIVNSNDDNGVLVGNWTESYAGGKSPLSWNGSVAILRKYFKEKKPVKYGQCFVFAGVVTTICRALGIACRSVSNYASAHDRDGSVTVDFYWNVDSGESLPNISDSLWNFHCWNDVWMKRRDLPNGYGGWQAIDATPQERSEGMFQLGPMSLRAVKEGNCQMLYDGPFLFAEVNGDKINWGKNSDGQWYMLNMDKSVVGQKISTKLPDGKPVRSLGTWLDAIRQDITDEYKYPEESDRERISVIAASRSSTDRNPIYSTNQVNENDVLFGKKCSLQRILQLRIVRDFICRIEKDVKISGLRDRDWILIGRDFTIDVRCTNSSYQRRTIEGKLICETVTYTGERQMIIKEHSFSTAIGPKSEIEISVTVKAKDYIGRLSEHASMKVSAILKVLETGQVESWQDDFLLQKPELNIEVLSDKITVGHPFKCRVFFRNPLPGSTLTGCSLSVEGPGVDGEVDFPVGNIAPDSEWAAILNLTPSKPGRRQLSLNFNCDQLRDINGATDFQVM